MNFELQNGDVVMIISLALLLSLILAFRARQITLPGLLVRAVVANVAAIAAVVGLQMVPALLSF